MMTMAELLRDAQFKDWMRQVPRLPPGAYLPSSPPWRLFVQKLPNGPWAYKDFVEYADAYRWMRSRLDRYHDFSLHCRRISFGPPVRLVKVKANGKVKLDDKGKPVVRVIVWRPRLSGDELPHLWCPYCRRPTVFKRYSRHHALGKSHPTDPSVERCSVCGASTRLAPQWNFYTRNSSTPRSRRRSRR